MHACMLICMYVCICMHACKRCGVQSKKLQAHAHSHARKNYIESSPAANCLQSRFPGLADCALHAFFFVVCAERPIRSDFRGCLMLLFSRAARTVFALARGRSGALMLGNDGSSYASARSGSLCHFLDLWMWSDAHHKLAIRKMKAGTNLRLLASRKHQNSTDQDGSGKLTLMFVCFCLSYHAQQAFANGKGSLMPPSPFAIFSAR